MNVDLIIDFGCGELCFLAFGGQRPGRGAQPAAARGGACLAGEERLSCLVYQPYTLRSAVMSFEILLPFGLLGSSTHNRGTRGIPGFGGDPPGFPGFTWGD